MRTLLSAAKEKWALMSAQKTKISSGLKHLMAKSPSKTGYRAKTPLALPSRNASIIHQRKRE
jgi:hypothetical protein